MALDSTMLEILRYKTVAAAEEMGLTLVRAARTIYIKEVADFSTAIAGVDGKFFAYPEALGVSAFVDLDLNPSLKAVGPLRPGDVILSNQPYSNGGLSTHLPDLQFIKPYFHGDQIVAYGWTFAHTSDIGGGVPSSISPRFSDVYQEGLQIPPVKLVREGRIDEGVLAIYLANCRSPETNLGDVKAMIAALDKGGQRIADVIADHGAETFVEAQRQLAAYAGEKARAVLRTIPNGVYEFWDYLDHDFVSSVPVRIRCRITVEDGSIHLDYEGSDPQLSSAFNVPTQDTRHPYLTLRLLHMVTTRDPSAPLNHGLLDSITASAPKGSLINPEYPAACGVRHATVMRLIDVASGALHKASPSLVPVAGGGTVLPVVLAEPDRATGLRRSMVIQSIVCGSGARDGSDGVDGRESGLSNTRNSPIERTEDEAGVMVEEYGLRSDSGGPGRWRGGTGVVYTIRILRDDCAVLARGLERFFFTPWGAAGGKAAAPCRVVLNIGRADERDITRVDMLEMKRGDTISLMTPGGGGFGDPFTRPYDEVLHDVERGFVSEEAARRDYGVAIRDGRVDQAESARLRSAPRPAAAEFDFGPNRLLWESVFVDELVTRLNAALKRFPASVRGKHRRGIYEAVMPQLKDAGGFDPAVIPERADAMRAHFAELVGALEAGEALR